MYPHNGRSIASIASMRSNLAPELCVHVLRTFGNDGEFNTCPQICPKKCRDRLRAQMKPVTFGDSQTCAICTVQTQTMLPIHSIPSNSNVMQSCHSQNDCQ